MSCLPTEQPQRSEISGPKGELHGSKLPDSAQCYQAGTWKVPFSGRFKEKDTVICVDFDKEEMASLQPRTLLGVAAM